MSHKFFKMGLKANTRMEFENASSLSQRLCIGVLIHRHTDMNNWEVVEVFYDTHTMTTSHTKMDKETRKWFMWKIHLDKASFGKAPSGNDSFDIIRLASDDSSHP